MTGCEFLRTRFSYLKAVEVVALTSVIVALGAIVTASVICGSSVSVTVTVKVQMLVLPAASVAMLVTVVTPFGKVAPEGGSLTREQLEMLDLYNREIRNLRKQLEIWRDFA